MSPLLLAPPPVPVLPPAPHVAALTGPALASSATEYSQFYHQYVYVNSPVVRVRCYGTVPGYVELNLRVEYLDPATATWQPFGFNKLLALGLDRVLTCLAPENLYPTPVPASVLPLAIQRRCCGTYCRVSPLLDTRYRVGDFEYSKEELISLSTLLRPDRLALEYSTATDDVVTLYEVGDTFSEWRQVFLYDLTPLATQIIPPLVALTRTLYRATFTPSLLDAVSLDPQSVLLIGYEGQGPELLLPVHPVALASEWPVAELRRVLLDSELLAAGLTAPAPRSRRWDWFSWWPTNY